MKQTILAALLLASTTSLFAQKETEKIEFRPHWYMQVQGGIGHTIGEGKFSDLVSPAAALSAGYRFTPVWGLRGGFSGWQGKGCWVNPRQEYKFNYAQLNAEATFDIANCLGGFNHKRFFNPYLFAGIGVNMAFNNDDAVALNEAGNKLQYLWDDTKAFVAGRLGVGMDFRICDAVAFNLEGKCQYPIRPFQLEESRKCRLAIQHSCRREHPLRQGIYQENTKGCPDFYPTPERTEGRAERGPETGCRA